MQECSNLISENGLRSISEEILPELVHEGIEKAAVKPKQLSQVLGRVVGCVLLIVTCMQWQVLEINCQLATGI